ncbi:MAG: PocR ligand-binding domain-containing protein [Clostridia bacterium]|nr:PocR ligand-binding domain-containing protein [Clostridia bacterium]
MVINYEIDKINTLLHDFYNSTGITIDLLKVDFSKVSHTKYEFNNYCKCIQETPEGKKACRMSEISLLEKCRDTKQTQMHICHAGLVDIAVPIIYEEEIIGYIIFGQLKTQSDFSKLTDYLQKLYPDTKILKKHYSKIAYYDFEKIQSVSNIASMLIKYILLENMLKPKLEDSIQKAINYIENNLDKELCVKSISKNINVSKSVLYKKFHQNFKCTVAHYINVKRVDKSIELLLKTDLSMEEISQRVGYASASYYSRIFKKIKGTTPLKFKRKENFLSF